MKWWLTCLFPSHTTTFTTLLSYRLNLPFPVKCWLTFYHFTELTVSIDHSLWSDCWRACFLHIPLPFPLYWVNCLNLPLMAYILPLYWVNSRFTISCEVIAYMLVSFTYYRYHWWLTFYHFTELTVSIYYFLWSDCSHACFLHILPLYWVNCLNLPLMAYIWPLYWVNCLNLPLPVKW